MARIAVGCWRHETNVFAPYRAKYEIFTQRDEWPPLSRGEQMLDDLQDIYSAVLPVISPGPVIIDLRAVPFQDPRLKQLSRKG